MHGLALTHSGLEEIDELAHLVPCKDFVDGKTDYVASTEDLLVRWIHSHDRQVLRVHHHYVVRKAFEQVRDLKLFQAMLLHQFL
jgi:hypothetical protein